MTNIDIRQVQHVTLSRLSFRLLFEDLKCLTLPLLPGYRTEVQTMKDLVLLLLVNSD